MNVQEWKREILYLRAPNYWIYQLHHLCLCCGIRWKTTEKLSWLTRNHCRGTRRLENISPFFFSLSIFLFFSKIIVLTMWKEKVFLIFFMNIQYPREKKPALLCLTLFYKWESKDLQTLFVLFLTFSLFSQNYLLHTYTSLSCSNS